VLYGADIQGRLEVMGLEVRSYPTTRQSPGTPAFDPIAATTLREIPLGEMLRELRAACVDALEAEALGQLDPSKPIEPDVFEWERDRARRQVDIARSSLHTAATGAPTLPDEHYREVAEFYSREQSAGRPPTRGVKERWGVSHSTAAKWVAKARRLKFLPETAKGVAKGAPRKDG
jgi:hypothetical protein